MVREAVEPPIVRKASPSSRRRTVRMARISSLWDLKVMEPMRFRSRSPFTQSCPNLPPHGFSVPSDLPQPCAAAGPAGWRPDRSVGEDRRGTGRAGERRTGWPAQSARGGFSFSAARLLVCWALSPSSNCSPSSSTTFPWWENRWPILPRKPRPRREHPRQPRFHRCRKARRRLCRRIC